MGTRGTAWVGIALLAALGCRDRADETGPAEPTPPAPEISGAGGVQTSKPKVERGACEFAVKGAVERTARAPGPAFPGAELLSRHLETPEGLRRRAAAVVGKKNLPPETHAAAIDELLAADPPAPSLGRPLLMLACDAGGVRVSFQALPTATLADIPFAPKRYQLAPGSEGEISALTLIDGQVYETQAGSLEFKRFETTGVSAVFDYAAQSKAGAAIQIAGELELACAAQNGACM